MSQILFYYDMGAQSLSHVQLFETPWTVAHQAPLSMGILQSRMGCHLPDPGIEPALAGGFFTH